MIEATTDPVRLPPGPALPSFVQGVAFAMTRTRSVGWAASRFGHPFSADLPIVGKAVVLGAPDIVKAVYLADSSLVGQASNLGAFFGPGSTFSLEGDAHRERRKLLSPPFHGRRMRRFESMIEDEAVREFASWSTGQPFPALPSMMRITVNAILRAVFGASSDEVRALGELLPRFVEFGSKLTVLPPAVRTSVGPIGLDAHLARMRQKYDRIVATMIERALADPGLGERPDVLAMMLRSTYDDGTRISHEHIADELLTLLAAGHETTATTLAWSLERLRRHPWIMSALADEINSGQGDLAQRVIWEVQRTRPVIEGTFRRARQRIRLGDFVVPEGHVIVTSMVLAHRHGMDERDADTFDPDRFIGTHPGTFTWIPYGGGVHRCIGAAFANLEMDVVLRTLFRQFELESTHEAAEGLHSRGVATAPSKGGVIVVHRRS